MRLSTRYPSWWHKLRPNPEEEELPCKITRRTSWKNWGLCGLHVRCLLRLCDLARTWSPCLIRFCHVNLPTTPWFTCCLLQWRTSGWLLPRFSQTVIRHVAHPQHSIECACFSGSSHGAKPWLETYAFGSLPPPKSWRNYTCFQVENMLLVLSFLIAFEVEQSADWPRSAWQPHVDESQVKQLD